MIDNKLIKALETLSRKEMTRFHAFIHSPYFNKHKDVRALVDYFNRIYPNFTKKNCYRTVVFKKVFGKTPHDQAKLALIFTYTFRLFEEFVATESVKEDHLVQKLYLLKSLRERRLNNLYEKELQVCEAEMEEKKQKDNDYYYQRFLLASEADDYYDLLSKHQKDLSIQDKQDNLDRFFLAEKLKDACEMKVREKILKVDYRVSLVDLALQEVERNIRQYENIPAILIYYRIFKLVDKGPVEQYPRLVEELEVHKETFSSDDLNSIYDHLVHYCIEQINKGNGDFLNELFQLYKKQLEHGFLLEDGFLSEWHYKNIVTTGLRLGDTEWVNWFIEFYKKKLKPDSQTNAYIFNKASYYYEVKQYDKVLDLLIRVEYSDIRYSQGAKALLLRTYYDIGEFEAFISLSESFKQYLHRNKLISDFRRKGFSNLIKFARRAFQLKIDAEYMKKEKFEKELQKLQRDIAASDTIFNLSWLKGKVEELVG